MSICRCAEWVKNCGVQSVREISAGELHKKARLCDLHFEDWCFMNPDPKFRNKLVWNAVPRIFKHLATTREATMPIRKLPTLRKSPPPRKKRKQMCSGILYFYKFFLITSKCILCIFIFILME